MDKQTAVIVGASILIVSCAAFVVYMARDLGWKAAIGLMLGGLAVGTVLMVGSKLLTWGLS